MTVNTHCEAEFRGRTAVVTGGSSGIGRAVTLALAKRGCYVFFCGRNLDAGRTAEHECDGNGHFIQCDLAADDGGDALIDAALAHDGGTIDYLVNNVADDTRLAFDNVTAGELDRFIAINLRPAVLAARRALPGLRRGRGRAVVNVGTTNFMLGLSPFTLYSAAKSGLAGFTRALARELGPEMIRVNMLSPGWIMTEKQLALHVTELDQQNLLRDQALPFLLTEDDVVPPLLFLLSSGAAGITGQNLVVDGGKLMQ